MRMNITKAILLTVAGAALVLLPRRSSKQDSHHHLVDGLRHDQANLEQQPLTDDTKHSSTNEQSK